MTDKNQYSSVYRENITDEGVLTLTTKNDDNQNTYLNFRYAGNKMRITCYTNLTQDKQLDHGGKLSTIISLQQWYVLLEYVNLAINEWSNGTSHALGIKGFGKDGYKGGTYTKEKIYVGKDDDGVIFISLFLKNRPVIKFPFTCDIFLELVDKEGNAISKATESKILAKAWYEQGKHVIGTLAATEFVAKDDRPSFGRKNNNSNKGNNYSNNQNQNLPF